MTRIATARAAPAAEDPNPRAAIGDNRPPVEEQGVADFNEAIDSHAGLRKRIDDLIGSSTRAIANDDDTMKGCAELIRQMSTVEKVVDDERQKVKRPYLDAGRRIEDAANALKSPLLDAKGKVRGLAENYMREQQRKADQARREREAELQRQREQQEEQAREELARAAAENRPPEPVYVAPSAPPPPVEPVRVRSDFGAVASARKVKVATITDWGKAFKAVKTVPAVQEAIQKAINALVRAGQTGIAGVEITEDVGLSVR